MQPRIGLETPPSTKDPEQEILSQVKAFRAALRDLAVKENDEELLALNFEKISEEDMVIFQRFQRGMFNLEDMERQERVLANLEEADTAKKLLSYMRKKLTRVVAA